MKKFKYALFLFIFSTFLACTEDAVLIDDPVPTDPEVVDPLEAFFDSWISNCVDLGGGPRNQLFVEITEEYEFKLALLNWTDDNCEGTFVLTNFDGDPLIEPAHEQDLKIAARVDGVPENFYVLKVIPVGGGESSFVVFHKSKTNKFDAMVALDSFPDTWEEALEEPVFQDFVNDPENAVSIDNNIVHFSRSKMPDPMAALHKTWLSDCADFGGGALVQPYAEFGPDEVLSANVVWSDPGCMGTYQLYNLEEGVIASPQHLQNIKREPVLGIPPYMFVAKVTTVGSSDPAMYALIYTNPAFNEFYELVAFDSSPATWDDWMLIPGVSDFTDDPTTAVAPMGKIILHFTNLPLPPN